MRGEREMKCKMYISRLILFSARYAVAMVIQYQLKKKKVTGGEKTKLLKSVENEALNL